MNGVKVLPKVLLILVLVGSSFYLGCARPAAADGAACPVWKARRDVERAEARLREAKRVLAETKRYSSLYGPAVGRWVRLARREGFGWSQLPTAMSVIHRESRGDPRAKNPASTASGLFQFLSSWWLGKWDPFDPVKSMHHAEKAVRAVGWSPWG